MSTKANFDGYLVITEDGTPLRHDGLQAHPGACCVFDTVQEAVDVAEMNHEAFGVTRLALLGFYQLPWQGKEEENG